MCSIVELKQCKAGEGKALCMMEVKPCREHGGDEAMYGKQHGGDEAMPSKNKGSALVKPEITSV